MTREIREMRVFVPCGPEIWDYSDVHSDARILKHLGVKEISEIELIIFDEDIECEDAREVLEDRVDLGEVGMEYIHMGVITYKGEKIPFVTSQCASPLLGHMNKKLVEKLNLEKLVI